jgi:AraC-like DNA-binding protein
MTEDNHLHNENDEGKTLDQQPGSDPTDSSPADELSREELLKQAGSLAASDDLLNDVAAACVEAAYAGPTDVLRLTYLAATTRLLEHPVSVALRGPSSAGKSFTIKQALAFVPPEEIVALTAMSDKALFYLDENLEHKVLLFAEADGLAGDFSAYALRSLLSEGELDYTYTDFDGKEKKTVRINKKGPTGLVTSSAKRIDFELLTRVLTPSIEDTPELTRAIFRTAARAAQGHSVAIDYTEFHALQRYIARGPREVVVPFADQLADHTDDKAVRLRRDFTAILILVQAHALLHQTLRDVDKKGRIVAQVADYATVHELVAPMMAEATEATVPGSVREAVEAVFKLETAPSEAVHGGKRRVTLQMLADELGISRSSVSRRVKRAIGLGYLRDVQPDRGGPKILETCEHMPGDATVLPPPEALE